MSADLLAGIVRVLDAQGRTSGTGFVVTDDGLIATCSHVVEAAGAGPGETVPVVFHATEEQREAHVVPEWWQRADAEDVAVLRLAEPLPEGVEPLLLGSSGGTSGHPFKTFGFPYVKTVDGMWGYGTLGDPTTEAGQRVLQLTGTTEVTRGFSGAPVLDTVTRRVVGMVTSITVPDHYGRLTETAFITPSETLRDICPHLRLSDICPYRGLAAFTEADAEFFFGREKLVDDMVAHLRGSPRFLAVVGPSGSGKSSVVKAGLFPALRRGKVPGSGNWRWVVFRPGADPFAAVAGAGLDATPGTELAAVVRSFMGDLPEVGRLVLCADQFEELFALSPEPVRERFLAGLLELLESDMPVTLILALRADFYDHLLCPEWGEWLDVGQVNVLPMREEELQAAVEEPAQLVGLCFEPGLAETIVGEARQVEHPLPLLEAALTQLWEQREEGMLTHTAFQKVGRVAGAISQWAEDTYNGLSTEERPLAQRIFTRLLRYGEEGIPDTRQRRSLTELVARLEEQELVHRLVQRLADARLLVTDRDPLTGEETAEIIHDAVLWEWARLQRWVTEQREFYLWRQRLDERLREWENQEQDEGALLRGALLAEGERWLAERSDGLNPDEREYIQEGVALREEERAAQERLRRRIILGLTVGLIVTVILALTAWGQRGVALDSRATAVAEAADRATAQVRAEEQRERAESEASDRATAQAQTEEERRIAVARQLAAQAQMVWDDAGTGLVRSTLLAIESTRRFPSLEGDQALHRGLALMPRLVARMDHEGEVRAVAFSPDGTSVASGSEDNTVRVWEAATGREVAQMAHEGAVRVVAYSPDGNWVASGSWDGTVRVWEAATGEEVARMEHEGRVEAVAFSPDGQWVASGGWDNTARVWEVATGREVARMEHQGGVGAVAFSPDGTRVVSGYERVFDNGGGAVVWEAATGQEVARMGHGGRVWSVAFSPDGKSVVLGGMHNTALVWDVATGRQVARTVHGGPVNAVAFSPDGRWVVSGSWDYSMRVWEAATGQTVSARGHNGAVGTVAFSPDGRLVVSGSADGTARVWEAATGQEVARIVHAGGVNSVGFSPDGRWVVVGAEDGTVWVWGLPRMEHGGEVNAVAFSPDGRWVASASSDRTVRVWEATTGQEVSRVECASYVSAVAFSPDGRRVASGSGDGMVRIWEAASGQEVTWMEDKYEVSAVAFSPDGKWVAVGLGSLGNTVRVVEVATGREVARVAHGAPVNGVAFSPDGTWVASSGSVDGTVQVWEAATGHEVARIECESNVGGLAFSPDGKWIAVALGSQGNSVRVWEAATGREVSRMVHESEVSGVAFSPDGRWVVSGSEDGMVRVWEAGSGQEMSRMVHDTTVKAVAFSPDGKRLASGSRRGTVRVWLWRPEDVVAEACSRLSRNLTREEWQQYIGDEPCRATCPNLPDLCAPSSTTP